MPALADFLDAILSETYFDAKSYGRYSALEIHHMHARGDEAGQFLSHIAKAVVPEVMLAELTDRLSQELQAYIEPNSQRLGTGLVALMGGALNSAEPKVAEFAETLIEAAASLGSARAVEILLGWIAGEPYRFRMMMLLTGVRCEQPLSLEEGVQVTQLPASVEELSAHLPYTMLSTDTVRDLLGRAVLSIDGTAEPALYRPTSAHPDRPDWNLRQVWAGGRIPSLMTDLWRQRISDALSLACDHYVLWTHIWRDVGDLEVFNRSGGGSEFREASSKGDEISLEQEHLETARDLAVQREANSHNGRALDMAISRWISSKRPYAALADRFIDLRIAFETLYLPQSRTEMRFRLAMLGAWHLGADFEERRRYYDLLRDAYDCGSAAVHTGEVEGTPRNLNILTDAQSACRTAILKRLAEAEEPAWNEVDLALGARDSV